MHIACAEEIEHRRVNLLAFLGEEEAAAAALAEPHAQSLLEQLHVRADRGLGHAERVLRSGEAVMADHRLEDAQELQIEVEQGGLTCHTLRIPKVNVEATLFFDVAPAASVTLERARGRARVSVMAGRTAG